LESCRRRQHLGFSHHVEVAALPAAEADALLDWREETIGSGGGLALLLAEHCD